MSDSGAPGGVNIGVTAYPGDGNGGGDATGSGLRNHGTVLSFACPGPSTSTKKHPKKQRVIASYLSRPLSTHERANR